jgi:hypothetical protein
LEPVLLEEINENDCPEPEVGLADVPSGDETDHAYVAPDGQASKSNGLPLHCGPIGVIRVTLSTETVAVFEVASHGEEPAITRY